MKKQVTVLLALTLAVTLFVSLATLAAGTLTVAKTADAVSLDPHDAAAGPSMEVYVNIYESLTRVAPDGSIVPWLAESWERIDEDTMRFYLREGVQFHDGTPFNADAVKFAIERAIDPENPARVAGSLGPVAGADVIDDYTVDVSTTVPYGPIALSMSHFISIGMISPTAVELYGDDFGRNPVGTGPFKFVEWIPNERIELARNENYWGEAASLDGIVYTVIPDLQSQHFALENGEVDMLLNPEPARILTYKASSQYNVYEVAGLRVMFFGFDTAEGVTMSKAVRQAAAHAIDAGLIAEAILEGTATPAQSFVAPAYFGYKDVGLRTKYAYDPAASRALLAGEGYTDTNGDGLVENAAGETLTLTVYAPEGRYPKDRETAIAVQYMLKQAGFDAQVLIEPWGNYIAALGKPTIEVGHETYDMHLVGWASSPDAARILEPLFQSIKMPPDSCCNWFYFANERIDTLLETAQASSDQALRAASYAEVQDILAEELPIIPFVILNEIVVTQSNVLNYEPHPLDLYKGYFYSVEKN